MSTSPRAPLTRQIDVYDIPTACGEYTVVELTDSTVTVEVCRTWIVTDTDRCIDRLCGHVDTVAVLSRAQVNPQLLKTRPNPAMV